MSKKDALGYSDDEGRKAVVAAEITFYLTTLANRAALVEAYAAAMKHIGKEIRWYRTEAMSRPKGMEPAVYEFFDTWFKPGAKLRSEYELTLTSGDTPDTVGPWGLRFGVEPPSLSDIAGFVQLNMPREVFDRSPQTVVDLVLDFANRLEFRSGHAGYGVQYDEGEIDDERDQQIGALCRRYQTVDYRDFAATGEFMTEAIKGVSWLTCLDSGFVEDLGGLEALIKALGKSITVHRCQYGIVLQAGAVPVLGDRNKREDVSAYRKVFSVLEEIIVKEDLRLPGFDEDGSIEWVNRFE
jgi:hypothetical protein